MRVSSVERIIFFNFISNKIIIYSRVMVCVFHVHNQSILINKCSFCRRERVHTKYTYSMYNEPVSSYPV